MIQAVVEWDKLLEVVWVSMLAGVGTTALFAIVIYGSSRADEARRERRASAPVFGVVALFSLVAFAGVVVLAILEIVNKK